MDENTYEVGCGKPPKHSQFQKGRSGNPKGSAQETERTSPRLVLKAFGDKVVVKSPGGCHSMTKLAAALVQLVNKALSGDIKAFREMIRFVRTDAGTRAVSDSSAGVSGQLHSSCDWKAGHGQ